MIAAILVLTGTTDGGRALADVNPWIAVAGGAAMAIVFQVRSWWSRRRRKERS